MKLTGHHRMGLSLAGMLMVAALPAFGQEAVAEATDQEWTQPGESGAPLPEMVVEATNEVRQKIDKGTFEFHLDAATVDSFYSAMDEEALGVSPVSGLQPHLNNLESLYSDQPPHFWIQDLASTPVATFYPNDPEGHEVKAWQLTVTDFRGSPFKSFLGNGNPPGKLDWDGMGDSGEMLKVGYPYSYVFKITDKGTNNYNYAGIGFRIPALDYREEGNRVLELAGGQLFARAESDLTEAGELWLTRSTDIIRQHPYSPVRVRVTAEAQDLAEARAAEVAAYLAESMILPLEQVKTEALMRADLRSELDGSVAVVVEHVDD